MVGLCQVLPWYGRTRTAKWARGKAVHVRGGFQLGRRMRVRAQGSRRQSEGEARVG